MKIKLFVHKRQKIRNKFTKVAFTLLSKIDARRVCWARIDKFAPSSCSTSLLPNAGHKGKLEMLFKALFSNIGSKVYLLLL
jgi:hypothetical protein